jgi:hypothetical protein
MGTATAIRIMIMLMTIMSSRRVQPRVRLDRLAAHERAAVVARFAS